MAAKAEAAFGKWDFVSAVFVSQAAYRAAAAHRDLARGLPPGTTELERGTKNGRRSLSVGKEVVRQVSLGEREKGPASAGPFVCRD